MRINHFIDAFDTKLHRNIIKRALNNEIKFKVSYKTGQEKQELEAIKELTTLADNLERERAHLISLSNEYAHFDIGNLYDDLSTEEHVSLAEYSKELIKEGLFKLPYDKICISFPYGDDNCQNMVMIEAENENILNFRVYQKIKENNPLNDHPTGFVFTLFIDRGDKIYHNDGFFRIKKSTSLISGEKLTEQEANQYAGYVFSFTLAINAILCSEGITINTRPAPTFLNKKRAKLGKSPIPEIKEIRIKVGDKKYNFNGTEIGGKHASPRLHWRRGHIRRLKEGKITNVRPCLVGEMDLANPKEPLKPNYKICK